MPQNNDQVHFFAEDPAISAHCGATGWQQQLEALSLHPLPYSPFMKTASTEWWQRQLEHGAMAGA